MKDNEIIQLMKMRPEKGLYEAIRKYEGLLTAVASRILHSEQDIEECVSDTFVGVWKHLESLHEYTGNLKGYLICAVRNHAINRYHKNARNKSIPQSDSLDLFERQENMETEILDRADLQVLLTIIDGMGEPDREILVRKHFLLEPSTDIAERLHMKPHQIRYRLQRSKKHLLETLAKRGIRI